MAWVKEVYTVNATMHRVHGVSRGRWVQLHFAISEMMMRVNATHTTRSVQIYAQMRIVLRFYNKHTYMRARIHMLELLVIFSFEIVWKKKKEKEKITAEQVSGISVHDLNLKMCSRMYMWNEHEYSHISYTVVSFTREEIFCFFFLLSTANQTIHIQTTSYTQISCGTGNSGLGAHTHTHKHTSYRK